MINEVLQKKYNLDTADNENETCFDNKIKYIYI